MYLKKILSNLCPLRWMQEQLKSELATPQFLAKKITSIKLSHQLKAFKFTNC